MTQRQFIDKKIDAILEATGIEHIYGPKAREDKCPRCLLVRSTAKALKAAIRFGAKTKNAK